MLPPIYQAIQTGHEGWALLVELASRVMGRTTRIDKKRGVLRLEVKLSDLVK